MYFEKINILHGFDIYSEIPSKPNWTIGGNQKSSDIIYVRSPSLFLNVNGVAGNSLL